MNTQSKSSGPTTGYWVVLGLIVLGASAGGSLIGWLFLRPMVKAAGGVGRGFEPGHGKNGTSKMK